jgi:hypothetical protein
VTVTYVSDLNPTSATSGNGPYERDHTNGGSAAGDGGPIKINGVTYAKGLGTHSAASITYALGGAYNRFRADLGLDDVVANQGRVTYEVWVNGVRVFDSGPITGASPTLSVNVPVTGATTLRLVVTNGGDGSSYDHADWGSARLEADTP